MPIQKLGVLTKHDGGPCPKCGAKPTKDGEGVWTCPNCGTRPFEVDGEEAEEADEEGA